MANRLVVIIEGINANGFIDGTINTLGVKEVMVNIEVGRVESQISKQGRASARQRRC